jgi:uncharacterized glyoxalase superfamily protein PhnB
MAFNKLTPNFEVHNIRETVNFYESALGFSLAMAVPETQDRVDQSLIPGHEYVYALMGKDNIELMFQKTESFHEDVIFAAGMPIGASVSFYMDVTGLNNLHNQLKEKVAEITELKTTWYGMKEFYIKDINGYILGFAEKSE